MREQSSHAASLGVDRVSRKKLVAQQEKVAKKLREKVLRAEGKENGVKHIEAWGGGTNVSERKKPYGDQTLSNASLKYRESKMKGRPDDMAAAAAYKARMRVKKAGSSAHMPLGVKKSRAQMYYYWRS